MSLNGKPVQHTVADESLTLPDVPDAFTLETVTRICPQKNTKLEGLYATRHGFVTQCEAQGFRRITYFLERVVPVATASKVRLACHPHDPMTPPGFRGFEKRVLGDAEGLMKFVQIAESPYHGLNFCQGTVAEGMEDPRSEIGEVIPGPLFNAVAEVLAQLIRLKQLVM